MYRLARLRATLEPVVSRTAGDGPPVPAPPLDLLPPAILLDPTDGCLTAARSLIRRGVTVHVLATGYFGFVARTRGARGEVLPLLPAGRGRWLERLTELGRQRDAVLISGSDWASEFLSRERQSLPESLRSFESSTGAHLRLMDKSGLYDFARSAGVRTPWTEIVTSPEELDAVAGRADYPCIVKPLWSHSGKRKGDYRTRQAADQGELRRLVGQAIADGVEMLVTEHVPGDETNLEAAVTIRSADGSYPLVYGRHKVRQFPPDYGVGSMHRSAPVPEAIEATRRLLDAASFEGISITEFKRHEKTDERVLIEVNVRVPRGFGLGDACEADASWRLYATLAGLPLPPQPPPRNGISAVLPEVDFHAARARMRRGELSLRELLASYRGVRDTGVLSLRDPAPTLGLLAQAARARLRPGREAGAEY